MADYNMGWHLEQAGKLSEAYAHYRKAADGNDDDSASVGVGAFYENGVVVAQDGKEARRCYETGEKLGECEMQNALGALQALGIGGRRAKKPVWIYAVRRWNWQRRQRKEDYGYEARNESLRRTIAERRIMKGRKGDCFGAMSLKLI